MNRNRKRAVAFIVTLAMLFPVFPSAVFSEEIEGYPSSKEGSVITDVQSGETEGQDPVRQGVGDDDYLRDGYEATAETVDGRSNAGNDAARGKNPKRGSLGSHGDDGESVVSGSNADNNAALDKYARLNENEDLNNNSAYGEDDESSEFGVLSDEFLPFAVNKFTVTFDVPAAVTSVDAQVISEGGVAADPGKAGVPTSEVSFRGWYLTQTPAADEDPYDFSTPITGDITLYAVYSNMYMVAFLTSRDVARPASREGVYFSIHVVDGDVADPTEAEKSFPLEVNSRVSAWELYDEVTDDWTAYDFSSPVVKDIFLRPVVQYYVFFVSDGTQVPFQVVTHGALAQKPGNPTKVGYTFKDWNTPTGAAFDFNLPITESISLEAVWEGGAGGYELVFWLEKPNLIAAGITNPGVDLRNYELYYSTTVTALAGTNVTDAFVSAAAINHLAFIPKYATYGGFTASSGVVMGDGSTEINVFLKRIAYTSRFFLWTNLVLTMGGVTYTAPPSTVRYVFSAKCGDDISDLWPAIEKVYSRTVSMKCYGWGFESPSVADLDNFWTNKDYFTEDMLPLYYRPNNEGWYYSFVDTIYSPSETHYLNYYFEIPVNTTGALLFNGAYYLLSSGYSKVITKESMATKAAIVDIEGYVKPTEVFTVIEAPTGVLTAINPPLITNQAFFYRLPGGKDYKIYMNPAGGSPPASAGAFVLPVSVSAGALIMEKLPYRWPVKAMDGKQLKFLGWKYYDDKGVYVDCTPGSIMPKQDIVLTAQWEGVSSGAFIVNIYGEEGAMVTVSSLAMSAGTKIDISKLPYKLGDTHPSGASFGILIGWKVKGSSDWYNFEKPVWEEFGLYAVWQVKKEFYRIVYLSGDADGGTGPMDLLLYAPGVEARVKNNLSPGGFTKTVDPLQPDAPWEWVFIGWRLTGTGIMYYEGSTITVTAAALGKAIGGEIALVPVFEPWVGVRLNSNYQDGTTELSKRDPVVKNGVYTLPASPPATFVKSGYDFAGWSETSKGAVVTYTEWPMRGEPKEFFAVWKESGGNPPPPPPPPVGSEVKIAVLPYIGYYDGQYHGVSVSYAGITVPSVQYRQSTGDPWAAVNPTFKDVKHDGTGLSYSVWVAIADGGNVLLTTLSSVTISPVALTVQAPSASITKGAQVPTNWAVSFTGFVAGESAANLSGSAIITVPGFVLNTVGTFPVTATGFSSFNYDIRYVAGLLTVSDVTSGGGGGGGNGGNNGGGDGIIPKDEGGGNNGGDNPSTTPTEPEIDIPPTAPPTAPPAAVNPPAQPSSPPSRGTVRPPVGGGTVTPPEVVTPPVTPVTPGEPPVTPPEVTPTVPITPPDVPAAGTGAWALLNLILAILGAIIALIIVITAFKKEEDEVDQSGHRQKNVGNEREQRDRRFMWRLLGVIAGIAGLVVFVLTENMRLPMIFTDRWTILMVVIFVLVLAFTYLVFRKHDRNRNDGMGKVQPVR